VILGFFPIGNHCGMMRGARGALLCVRRPFGRARLTQKKKNLPVAQNYEFDFFYVSNKFPNSNCK